MDRLSCRRDKHPSQGICSTTNATTFNCFIEIIPFPQSRPRVCGKFTYDKDDKKKKVLSFLLRHQKPDRIFTTLQSLTISFFLPIPITYKKKIQSGDPHTKRPDLDNYIKAILDAMNGIYYTDDSIIYYLIASKQYATIPGIQICIVGNND